MMMKNTTDNPAYSILLRIQCKTRSNRSIFDEFYLIFLFYRDLIEIVFNNNFFKFFATDLVSNPVETT